MAPGAGGAPAAALAAAQAAEVAARLGTRTVEAAEQLSRGIERRNGSLPGALPTPPGAAEGFDEMDSYPKPLPRLGGGRSPERRHVNGSRPTDTWQGRQGQSQEPKVSGDQSTLVSPAPWVSLPEVPTQVPPEAEHWPYSSRWEPVTAEGRQASSLPPPPMSVSMPTAPVSAPTSRRGRSRPCSPMRSEYQWLEALPPVPPTALWFASKAEELERRRSRERTPSQGYEVYTGYPGYGGYAALWPPPPLPPVSEDLRLRLEKLEAAAEKWLCAYPPQDFRLDLSARPKNSAELVEKSKVDPEKFRIWHVGGRANTPLSYWKAWKRADLQTRPATTAGHVRSFLAAWKVVQLVKESKTCAAYNKAVGPDIATGVQGFQLRAATLWILHPRRTLGILDGQLRLQKTRPLDGAWISNEDGSLRGEVQGERDKRRRTTARVGGFPLGVRWHRVERQENLCLMVDGVRHFAVLSLDGRRISWADGDVWLRAESLDPEEVAFQETVKTQCEDPLISSDAVLTHADTDVALSFNMEVVLRTEAGLSGSSVGGPTQMALHGPGIAPCSVAVLIKVHRSEVDWDVVGFRLGPRAKPSELPKLSWPGSFGSWAAILQGSLAEAVSAVFLREALFFEVGDEHLEPMGDLDVGATVRLVNLTKVTSRHSERLSFKLENLRVVLFLADSPWRMDFALLSLEVVLQNA
ncbi:unnamed protein product [Durusdinium trenchii]|uniref:Uncharacterized protein n=1 Tax=Durusdinium trenchii TaxID=1381693 RepID=A0ABP0MWR7_9DINO